MGNVLQLFYAAELAAVLGALASDELIEAELHCSEAAGVPHAASAWRQLWESSANPQQQLLQQQQNIAEGGSGSGNGACASGAAAAGGVAAVDADGLFVPLRTRSE